MIYLLTFNILRQVSLYFLIFSNHGAMTRVINFPNSVTIGIHSLIVLAREQKPLNAIEIAERLNTSRHLVGKFLQSLVRDGYLSSTRGPNGGFLIKKDPSKILIYDVYRSIEGEVVCYACPHEDQICPTNMCIRDTFIKKITDDFIKYLKEYTIADYL